MNSSKYEFSDEKNLWLKETRNISFDEIIAALDQGKLLTIIEHPNQERYPNQKMYVINIRDYIHLVPFVKKNKNTVFLKTIFKSRKMMKRNFEKMGDEKL